MFEPEPVEPSHATGVCLRGRFWWVLFGLLVMALERGPHPAGGQPRSSDVEEVSRVLEFSAVGEESPALLPPDPSLDGHVILEQTISRYAPLQTGIVAEILNGPLLLEYTRMVHGVRSHGEDYLLYSWSENAQRLEVRALEGTIRSSISVLTREHGWIVSDGKRSEVGRSRLQARLAAYGLRNLLKIHLELPTQVSSGFGASGIHYLGREEGKESTLHVIALESTNNLSQDGVVMMAVEDKTFLLKKVMLRSADGLTQYRYSDFRVGLPSLRIPFRIELEREGAKDTVVIKRLEVLAKPPGGLLDEPGSLHLLKGAD